MAATFGYEFFKVGPQPIDLIKGITIPYCSDCDKSALLQAIGIIGAIIMPHNLYLHSGVISFDKISNIHLN
jgi:natural resistance-associated macrophage protein